MAEYLKRDIARILKKRPGTIEYYTASGLVIPDIEPSQGKGKPRVFSGRNLIEFGMIEVMSKMGISLAIVERVLSILRKGEWSQEYDVVEMTSESTAVWLERKQKNKVSFNNFWTSDDWGFTKELVFMQVYGFPAGEAAKEEWVEVVEKEVTATGLPVSRVFDPKASVATILWLGSIKNAAVRMVLG